jgi:hypothetical protein
MELFKINEVALLGNVFPKKHDYDRLSGHRLIMPAWRKTLFLKKDLYAILPTKSSPPIQPLACRGKRLFPQNR